MHIIGMVDLITNSSSETHSHISLIGPKLNACLVKIDGDIDAEDWTAFIGATFTGTRLDLTGAEMVADELAERIADRLDLAAHEVMVTTTCPCCFQITVQTTNPRVIAWLQGQDQSNAVGLLIRCIHDHWMNNGCYDSPASGEACEDCASEEPHECGSATTTQREPAKGPTLDV
jgi:hypothetical protein